MNHLYEKMLQFFNILGYKRQFVFQTHFKLQNLKVLLIVVLIYPSSTFIPTYTFIIFAKNFLPTCLFQPTRLFGTLEYVRRVVNLLNFTFKHLKVPKLLS